MIIQHNLSAINLQRQSKINNKKLLKSMSILSSGYRINSAADDAAGLTISEGMRAQIRGLKQASRNLEDGIGIIQTADGALAEVHDILNRMRELSIQSASDTNTEEDRAKMQEEIEQLAIGINRIAYDTEINEIRPLLGDALKTGSFHADPSYASVLDRFSMITAGQNGIFMFIPGMGDYAGAIGNAGNGGCASIRLLNADGTKTVLKVAQNSADGKGTYTMAPDGKTAVFEYKDTVKGIHFKVEQSCQMIDIMEEDSLRGGSYFKPTYNIVNLGTSSFNYDMYIHTDPINGGMSAAPSKDGSSLAGSSGFRPSGSNDLSIVCNPASYSAYTNCNVTAKFAGNGIDNVPDAVFAGGLLSDNSVSNTEYNIDTLYQIKNGTYIDQADSPDYHFSAGWLGKTAAAGSSFKASMMFGLSYPLVKQGGSVVSSKKDLWIQAGANSGQGFYIGLCNATSGNLGVDDLDITTHEKASEAIKKIDKASAKVSRFRGQFGAYQNRMEHAIAANENTAENLQAAESGIRDADMAKAMMEYTKESILQQIKQSLMAQVFKAPQSILGLLQ